MFTGIVESSGKVVRLTMKGADALLEIEAAMDLSDVSPGDSIAVNGACLTVTSKTAKTFTADVSASFFPASVVWAAVWGMILT